MELCAVMLHNAALKNDLECDRYSFDRPAIHRGKYFEDLNLLPSSLTKTFFFGALSPISFNSMRVGPRTVRPGRKANPLAVLHAPAVTGGVR